jgi:hypothetical protein
MQLTKTSEIPLKPKVIHQKVKELVQCIGLR